MPDPKADVEAAALELLAAGKVKEATELLKGAVDAAAPKPAGPARDAALVIPDILHGFWNLLGHHPALAPLFAELDKPAEEKPAP